MFESRPSLLATELILVVCLTSTSAAQRDLPAPCPVPLSVDLPKRTIGDIEMWRDGADLAASLGTQRVTVERAVIEGHPVVTHTIDVCGHKIQRHWNSVSWADRAFTTSEGLGVGSRISEFDALYGRGEGAWGSRPAVQYTMLREKTVFYLVVDNSCIDFQPRNVRVNRACVVRELSVIVPEAPRTP